MKVTTSFVDVYKVKGETMEIAFHNLKQEKGFDNYNMQLADKAILEPDEINNGMIFKHSRELYKDFVNNKLSEYTIFGALYNKKPIISDSSRVVMHNIISKGTKKWETTNSYRFDSGEIVEEDIGTKAEAMDVAKDLAIKFNKTINIIVSKRLVGMDGILGIAEFMPLDCVDETNIYVFWKYTMKVEEKDEQELYDDMTEVDDHGQMSIKEDLFGFIGRTHIS